ncbi:MAG: hypothetical protein ABFC57_12890 [Veillonellales bacterium]
MKKISTMEIILLVLFVAWTAVIDMDHLTGIEEAGLGAVFIYGVLMVIKVVKR